MERQLGQPERQHQRLRLGEQRRVGGNCEREAAQRAERKIQARVRSALGRRDEP